jgi:predicted metal-binding membrane protein
MTGHEHTVSAPADSARTDSTPHADSVVGALVKRDRLIVLGGLFVLCAAAWAYTAHLARGMGGPAMAMAMPQATPWDARNFPPLLAMWAAMMVAMMLPSAAPVLMLVAGVNRGRRTRGEPLVPTGIFLVGYLLIWTGFSAVAAGLQIILHDAALLSPRMASASPALGASILIAAGVYQWTALKRACLSHCRSPLHFLGTHWREGAGGALRMGFLHGAYCVGCCWLLMALLFVAGIMNLLWVAAIAGFVLVEKVFPGGEWVGRIAGLALMAGGAWVLHAVIG